MTELTVLLLAVLAAAGVLTVVAAERGQYTRAAAAGAAVVVAGWWLAVVAPLLTAGLAAAAVAVGWVRWTRPASTVSRWGARSRRKVGVASTLDIARLASWAAMRRQATVVRPSLAGVSWLV